MADYDNTREKNNAPYATEQDDNMVQNIPDFGDVKVSSDGKEFNSFRDKKSREINHDWNIIKSFWSAGIYRRQDMSMLNAFHRFPRIDPYRAIPTNREYAFFLKPNLHIFNDGNGSTLNPELETAPFFTDLMERGYAPILRQLEADVDYSHPFINILTNRKISNIDVPTIQAEDIETGQNFYGTKLKYRRGTERADEECDFSVEFEDTKYLEIYLLFKAFDEYEKRKWYGLVSPPDGYVENKVLHDQIAVYKFVVGEDGETLLYWAKYTGVYPVVIPRDIFSDMPQDGHLKITIQFRAMFFEDMMPNVLQDFNEHTNSIYNSDDDNPVLLWDNDIFSINGQNVYYPRIKEFKPGGSDAELDTEYSMYKLKWFA